jgi:hypothetical protein
MTSTIGKSERFISIEAFDLVGEHFAGARYRALTVAG